MRRGENVCWLGTVGGGGGIGGHAHFTIKNRNNIRGPGKHNKNLTQNSQYCSQYSRRVHNK
jgi:hypothetical protein